MKSLIKKILGKLIISTIPFIEKNNYYFPKKIIKNSTISDKARLFPPYNIINSNILDYTYIADHCAINSTSIGKFCAIGPNFYAGMGLHPTNGLSIAPMFYSADNLSNGLTLSKNNKFQENKNITIGNDVFIGINVTILDGVTIGNGAIIGAGSIVTKDIPDYAIAVGNPIQIIRYRFNPQQIEALNKIKWWDWDLIKLHSIEKKFFQIDEFIKENL